jgi:hypothetical protein
VYTHQHPNSPNKEITNLISIFVPERKTLLRLFKKGRADRQSSLPLSPLRRQILCVYVCGWFWHLGDARPMIPHHPSPWFPPQPDAPLQVLSKNRRVNMRTCMYDRWMILCNFGGDLFAPIVLYLYCIVLYWLIESCMWGKGVMEWVPTSPPSPSSVFLEFLCVVASLIDWSDIELNFLWPFG